MGTPTRVECSRCEGTGADPFLSMRDKGALGSWRARTAPHPFLRTEPGTEEQGTQAERVRRTGAPCALRLWAMPDALRTGEGPGSMRRRGRLSAAIRKRRELPGRCLEAVWSQRHPPTKGGKGLGSLATPVVAALEKWHDLGLRSWTVLPPRGCDRIARFPASLGRPPPQLESDDDIGARPPSHPWGGVCCGSCYGSCWESVWAPSLAATPPWTDGLVSRRPSLAGGGRGCRDRAPSTNKGAFLCWPGRGWPLFSRGCDVAWLPLSPPPSPCHPHGGEILATILLQGRGDRHDKGPSVGQPWSQSSFIAPPPPIFQEGEG